jgi:hypothetical protein
LVRSSKIKTYRLYFLLAAKRNDFLIYFISMPSKSPSESSIFRFPCRPAIHFPRMRNLCFVVLLIEGKMIYFFTRADVYVAFDARVGLVEIVIFLQFYFEFAGKSASNVRKLSGGIENCPNILPWIGVPVLKNGPEKLEYMFLVNRFEVRPIFALDDDDAASLVAD